MERHHHATTAHLVIVFSRPEGMTVDAISETPVAVNGSC